MKNEAGLKKNIIEEFFLKLKIHFSNRWKLNLVMDE